MAYIKNIDHEKVLKLADEVQVQPGQIVSKTLAQNKHVSVTLFAFDKGEEISTHESIGDAMVYVLEAPLAAVTLMLTVLEPTASSSLPLTDTLEPLSDFL